MCNVYVLLCENIYYIHILHITGLCHPKSALLYAIIILFQVAGLCIIFKAFVVEEGRVLSPMRSQQENCRKFLYACLRKLLEDFK